MTLSATKLGNENKPDILCFSTTDWDEISGSRQQIMGRLAAEGHRVLFIERQVGPEHILRDPDMRARKIAAWRGLRLRQVKTNLWLWQPPMAFPGRYYSLTLNNLGQKMVAARVRTILQQLSFSHPILWLYPPHSAPLIGKFNEQLVVYHCIERFAGEQTGRKRQVMLTQEEELLHNADLVFTRSDGLRRLYTPLTQRPIILVPSAADIKHFQSTDAIHHDIATIPSPRLVVMGTLDGRIDLDLLEIIAQARPKWHLVLIGHIRSERVNFSTLLKFPNVHKLGRRSFDELPQLLNGADVTLIPYVRNELTQYISPIKLYEYLAVGKPIISVDLPEVLTLKQWVEVVNTGTRSPQEIATAFITAIENSLSTNTPALQMDRRQAAQQHSWEKRVTKIKQSIELLL